MNDKDFTDKIQYTKEFTNSGRIRHRAKLEFFAEYYQEPLTMTGNKIAEDNS